MSQPCQACGTLVPEGSDACPRCATSRSLSRCSTCGNTGRVSPHRELRYACDLCGAPRLLVALPDRSAAAPLFRAANDARVRRAWWRGASVFLGLGTAFFATIALLLGLVWSGTAALVVAGLFALPGGLASGFAWSRAKAKGAEITPAVDAAWVAAATELARKKGHLSPEELAREFGIPDSEAEQLHAMLSVEASVGGSRLRVTEVDPLAARIDALEAAERERAATDEASREGERARHRAGPR